MSLAPNKIKLVHPLRNFFHNLLCDYPISEYIITVRGNCPTSTLEEKAELKLRVFPKLQMDGYVVFSTEIAVMWMKEISNYLIDVQPISVLGYTVKAPVLDDQVDFVSVGGKRGPYQAGVWHRIKLEYKVNLRGIDDPNFNQKERKS